MAAKMICRKCNKAFDKAAALVPSAENVPKASLRWANYICPSCSFAHSVHIQRPVYPDQCPICGCHYVYDRITAKDGNPNEIIGRRGCVVLSRGGPICQRCAETLTEYFRHCDGVRITVKPDRDALLKAWIAAHGDDPARWPLPDLQTMTLPKWRKAFLAGLVKSKVAPDEKALLGSGWYTTKPDYIAAWWVGGYSPEDALKG